MTYHYHVPIVMAAPNTKQGVGLPTGHVIPADVKTVGAAWWYNWAEDAQYLSDTRYVPMSWAGGYVTTLPYGSAGYLLVLNEPELTNQANLTPTEAARRVRDLAAAYPRMKLIVGGCGYFGRDWWPQFIAALGDYRPAGWHVHGYVETSPYWTVTLADVISWWDEARNAAPGGEFWITEFADGIDGNQTQALLDFVRNTPWVNRYAWFANRMDGNEWWYPQTWTNCPALVDAGGNLTETGKLYAIGAA